MGWQSLLWQLRQIYTPPSQFYSRLSFEINSHNTWCCPRLQQEIICWQLSDLSKKKGSSLIEVLFLRWPYATGKIFCTSNEVKIDLCGINTHEINYRSIVAMRETGKGHTNLSTFNGLMNLPSPMHIISFIKIQDNFSEVYKQVAVISM